ncbi:hypothetical protein E2L06_19640 [Haloterrigena sp. H1]|uniref:hypothetical protein n=1 Tax=Haloterrigena sp. H1 TaxID=2552943 RepID=UPI00110D40F1|nr:hypothetical protein [Haloterrigena sp. H1]TMT79043.1 hypothetical protein E2L06_19640 [Haloterrigena sp. H1]
MQDVAAQYDVPASHAAHILRDFETTPELAPLETLVTGFDPTPVGVDEGGHLYLRADADPYWDVVAEELGLTAVGRDVIATAHDRHVSNATPESLTDCGPGFVVSCPEFPAAAIDDIHTLLERMSVSSRRATVWALDHQARSLAAIANILSISEPLVRTDLAAVNRATRRVVDATRALDIPHCHLTHRVVDPLSPDWLGANWSPWLSLHDRDQLLDDLPHDPGVYRVRHTAIPGLLYIGETGADGGIRSRVGLGLADGLTAQNCPDGGNHDATTGLWQIATALDGNLEVSVATPPIAANRRHRRALEATLIAVCRREIGWTPSVQLNRTPLADTPSPGVDPCAVLESSSEENSYPVPSWLGGEQRRTRAGWDSSGRNLVRSPTVQ